ncbi:MAG TPA: NADH-quinone oxidoreductase subunit C [Candidatus Nitrosotenuis sp.]|nr:NADH-quinone oxidoreductase subunit C [Candidatus Nitrosotenuis sp.]
MSEVLGHEQFLKCAEELSKAGSRFVSLSALSLEDGEVELGYYFEVKDEIQALVTRTQEHSSPSLFSLFGASDFPEREASRRYGVKFVGHPNLPRGSAS